MGRAKGGNRRRFLRSLASIPAIAGLQTASPIFPANNAAEPAFAYVGSQDHIEVFTVSKSRWTLKQKVSSRRPASLVLLSDKKLLFAVNEVDEYLGLPTGSAESYSIDSGSGTLSLVSRQSLSLSATKPRNLVAAPDRQYLAVAVYGGGAYNSLPIFSDGKLGPVTQVSKEIGCGAHTVRQASAHPHSIAVHPSGRFFIGTDLGSDRINVFATKGRLTERVCSLAVHSGDGPAHIAIHPSGSLLFVSNKLSRSVASYRVDNCTGQIIDPQIRVVGARGALAVHPSGRFLYSTHPSCSKAIALWAIDQGSGALSLSQSMATGPHSSLLLSRGGESLFLLGSEQGCSAMHIEIDRTTGRLGKLVELASMQSPRCLALLYS